MAADSGVLRLIDANANRAREALRVIEDYARFVLDDEQLVTALKTLRHEVTGALSPVLGAAILHRDTPGDVGVAVKVDGEMQRSSLEHVVVAAGKRLGEALRSLEEYLKIDHPASAATIERARYSFYDIERRIALTLTPGGARRSRLASARLYVLITESACLNSDWKGVARATLAGGADVLQLREKTLESGELLERAVWLAGVCREAGALLIVNDRPDIALLSGADGVHVGQSDLPAVEVRKILGPEMIVGVSTHEPAHAHAARLDSADYIGAGPTFRSSTKPREIDPGLAYLEKLRDFGLPCFAIAGITEENLARVMATGTTRIAVTAAVSGSSDPEGATRRLADMLNTATIKPTP